MDIRLSWIAYCFFKFKENAISLDYSILVALKFTGTFDRYCFDRFSIVYCLFKLKRDESNSILKFCIRFDAYCSRLLSFKI